MSKTIAAVFEKYTPDLVVNDQLARQIISFDHKFVTKNHDHVQFFGGPLIGVHPIKWLESDRNAWIDDIVQLDEIGAKEELLKVIPKVKQKTE